MDIRQLFERHYPGLVRFLYERLGDHDQAEDLAQDVFVRLITRPPRDPHGWLYVVAANLVRDVARGETRRLRHLRLMHADQADWTDETSLNPERAMVQREDIQQVRATLGALSERDRTLLLLRADGLAYREIARTLGVAPTSIAPLLARAQRRFLRAFTTRPDETDLSRASG